MTEKASKDRHQKPNTAMLIGWRCWAFGGGLPSNWLDNSTMSTRLTP